MLSFSLWDLFGNFGVMMRGQGVNIILNLFFGPAINAACGFANYVQGAVRGFADNFMTAIRPSIVKTYSIYDYDRMQSYMIGASKYAFCLMLLLSTPLIFEAKFIIDLWLKNPPEYTYQFCVISLCINLVRTLFSPLMFGIHATGRVRNMSIANGSILILIVPISYILLRLGASPIIPFVVDFILMFLLALSCAFFLKQNMQEFSIKEYIKKATLPCLILGIICFPLIYIVKSNCDKESFLRFVIVSLVSTSMIITLAYWIILDKSTRKMVIDKIKEKFSL
jgi:O-antigen/teichoic acid export membrane protein